MKKILFALLLLSTQAVQAQSKHKVTTQPSITQLREDLKYCELRISQIKNELYGYGFFRGSFFNNQAGEIELSIASRMQKNINYQINSLTKILPVFENDSLALQTEPPVKNDSIITARSKK